MYIYIYIWGIIYTYKYDINVGGGGCTDVALQRNGRNIILMTRYKRTQEFNEYRYRCVCIHVYMYIYVPSRILERNFKTVVYTTNNITLYYHNIITLYNRYVN